MSSPLDTPRPPFSSRSCCLDNYSVLEAQGEVMFLCCQGVPGLSHQVTALGCFQHRGHQCEGHMPWLCLVPALTDSLLCHPHQSPWVLPQAASCHPSHSATCSSESLPRLPFTWPRVSVVHLMVSAVRHLASWPQCTLWQAACPSLVVPASR